MENPESLPHQEAVDGERVLFDRGGLKVTQHRFVVERTVYAMQNITSIQHEIDQPSPTPHPTITTAPYDQLRHWRSGFAEPATASMFTLEALGVPVGIVLLRTVGIHVAGDMPYGGTNIYVTASRLPERPPRPTANAAVSRAAAHGEADFRGGRGMKRILGRLQMGSLSLRSLSALNRGAMGVSNRFRTSNVFPSPPTRTPPRPPHPRGRPGRRRGRRRTGLRPSRLRRCCERRVRRRARWPGCRPPGRLPCRWRC